MSKLYMYQFDFEELIKDKKKHSYIIDVTHADIELYEKLTASGFSSEVANKMCKAMVAYATDDWEAREREWRLTGKLLVTFNASEIFGTQ